MHTAKAGRNDSCPCGSGRKYKKCCEAKAQKSRGSTMMLVVVAALMIAGLAAGISSFRSDRHVSRPAGVWSAEHGHYH